MAASHEKQKKAEDKQKKEKVKADDIALEKKESKVAKKAAEKDAEDTMNGVNHSKK